MASWITRKMEEIFRMVQHNNHRFVSHLYHCHNKTGNDDAFSDQYFPDFSAMLTLKVWWSECFNNDYGCYLWLQHMPDVIVRRCETTGMATRNDWKLPKRVMIEEIKWCFYRPIFSSFEFFLLCLPSKFDGWNGSIMTVYAIYGYEPCLEWL